MKQLAVLLNKKLKLDGYNILQNNFTVAGQVIKNFHVHIIPRYFNEDKSIFKIVQYQVTEEELDDIVMILKSL